MGLKCQKVFANLCLLKMMLSAAVKCTTTYFYFTHSSNNLQFTCRMSTECIYLKRKLDKNITRLLEKEWGKKHDLA